MKEDEKLLHEGIKIVHLIYLGFIAFIANILVVIGAANKLENRLTKLETKQEMMWLEMREPPSFSYYFPEKKKAP